MYDHTRNETYVSVAPEPRAGADLRQIAWVRLKKAVDGPPDPANQARNRYQLSELLHLDRTAVNGEPPDHPEILKVRSGTADRPAINADPPFPACLLDTETGEIWILGYDESARASRGHLGFLSDQPGKEFSKLAMLVWHKLADKGGYRTPSDYRMAVVSRTSVNGEIAPTVNSVLILRIEVNSGNVDVFDLGDTFSSVSDRTIRPKSVYDPKQSDTNGEGGLWEILEPFWYDTVRSREGDMLPAQLARTNRASAGLWAVRANRKTGDASCLQCEEGGAWYWHTLSADESANSSPDGYEFLRPQSSRLSSGANARYAPLLFRRNLSTRLVEVLRFQVASDLTLGKGTWISVPWSGDVVESWGNNGASLVPLPGVPGNSFGYGGVVMCAVGGNGAPGVAVLEINLCQQGELVWPTIDGQNKSWQVIDIEGDQVERTESTDGAIEVSAIDLYPHLKSGRNDHLPLHHALIFSIKSRGGGGAHTSWIAAPRTAEVSAPGKLFEVSATFSLARVRSAPGEPAAEAFGVYVTVPTQSFDLVCMKASQRSGGVWIVDAADSNVRNSGKHKWHRLQWYKLKRYDLSEASATASGSRFEMAAVMPIHPPHNIPLESDAKQHQLRGLAGFLVDQGTGRVWCLNLMRLFASRGSAKPDSENVDTVAGHRWLRSFDLLEMDGWTFDVDYSVDGDWVADFANK